jgi:hypothetical protein
MNKNKCIVPGCMREIAIKKHRMCKAHVNRMYEHGDPGDAYIHPRKLHNPYRITDKK